MNITHPLSISQIFPEKLPEIPTPSKNMTLFCIYAFFFVSSAGLLYRSALFCEWTPTDITSILGACSALFAAIVAGYIAVINARTKARIEEHRAATERNSVALVKLETELVKNTAATEQARQEVVTSVDQAKVRVEELSEKVEGAKK